MAFMEPEVTDKQEWAGVETTAGFWWVPIDVLSKSEVESARRGDFEPLLKYAEGSKVYNDQSSLKKGYGVRLSARGYMDATDWEVYGSKKEALRRARELAAESEGDHATKKSKKPPEPCVNVAFRVFPDGDVIALFPNEAQHRKGQILSYQHLGQHGEASRALIKELRKATRAEYGPLLGELKSLGYCLRVES